MNKTLILVPTLGERETYLKETLQSLAEQTCPIDVVLLFPKWNDTLRALASDYPAFEFRCSPGKLADSVNKAVFEDESHVYANWIGDDDRLPPNSVALAQAKLESDPALVLVHGFCQYINASGDRVGESRIAKWGELLVGVVPAAIKLEGGLFTVWAFKKVGGLDRTLISTPDVDLVLKFRRLGKIGSVNEVLSEFRIHTESPTTFKKNRQLREAHLVQLRHTVGLERLLSHLLRFPISLAIRFTFLFMGSRESKVSRR